MKKNIVNMVQGFCMALADSVPGISGGTVAFILGFYERFINSVNAFVTKGEDKRKACSFLFKLGIGWAIGMALASIVLSKLFEEHIYSVSSLFIGFIVFAIPLIVKDERDTLKGKYKYFVYFVIGILVVSLITYFNPVGGGSSVDFINFSPWMCLMVFMAGVIAICAMVVPGISGSTLLLIFGLYVPIINGINEVLHFEFGSLPILIVFGFGVITGLLLIVKVIKRALDKYRAQTIYMVLGLMVGSIYAIVMGPTSLSVPRDAMSFNTFSVLFFIIGGIIVYGLEVLRKKLDK
jgi:putative membrane protein